MRTIEELISEPRLAPYVHASSHLRAQPMDLYVWNSQIAAAFFESLHYVEVGLRNAIDRELQAAFAEGDNPWFSMPILTRESVKRVKDAQRRAGGASPRRGKVIAELSLGFWWSLFSADYSRTLWQPALQHAFEGKVRRQRLHQELDNLRLLRNRIAHHEPIFGRDLDRDWYRLIDMGARIATALAEQVEQTSRVPQVLATRPT